MGELFIDATNLESLLTKAVDTPKDKINKIIEKSRLGKGLTLDEAASLINIEDEMLLGSLFDAARQVKEGIYGKRIVLFAPLYTSNECTNDCLYCGFRCANDKLNRKTLTKEEIVAESKAIEQQGHKRILMVCGEEKKKNGVSHITEAINAVYQHCDIRRINVNCAPLTVEEFKELKSVGIGTYQIFQETYHYETYKKMHPKGMKSNYEWRLTAPERALEAGIDDIGIGALLGLYDYKFDILAVLAHAEYMDKKYGVGPHTISIPRLRPALGWGLNCVPYPISDSDFKKIVAVIRLAVPYTGIILSTREASELRDELLDLGVSQISAGSKTSPGGYKEKELHDAEQFYTNDHRTLDEMLKAICESGYIPSFCTACYRRQRTGQHFMEYAKEGEIHDFCQPNAILTFKENLLDYASQETIAMGEKVIEKALQEITSTSMREKTIEKLKEIENGKRDLYF